MVAEDESTWINHPNWWLAALGIAMFLRQLVSKSSLIRHFFSVLVTTGSMALIQVRIDHKDGMLHFGGDTLDSESFHVHISRMAERLSASLRMIHPGDSPQRKTKVADAISKARDKSHTEHTQALARKVTKHTK